MRIKSIDEKYGIVAVTNVNARGEYRVNICGYPAYVEIFCQKMTVKIVSQKIGEKKKVAFICSSFPKKLFIHHLIAARINYRLSINEIKEIAKGLDYLRI